MFLLLIFYVVFYIRTKVAQTTLLAKKKGRKISIIYNKGVSSRSDLAFDDLCRRQNRNNNKTTTFMELTGKIIAVLAERGGVSKAGNEWKIQEYVLETMEQYPRKMMFNVFGTDRIAQFNIQLGETLTVSFDIDSREYNGRWFNDIRAWKVDRNVAPAAGAPVAVAGAPVPPPVADPFSAPQMSASNAADDLPF
jgi:hypothetical protein